MAFVKEAEALIERGQAERLRGEEGMRCVTVLWAAGVRSVGVSVRVSIPGQTP